MVFCIVVGAICGVLWFICCLLVSSSPDSRGIQELMHSVTGSIRGSHLLRLACCGVVVLGMFCSIAAGDAPGQEPVETPYIEVTSTPQPSPEEASTPEPATPEATPEPSANITPGSEIAGAEGKNSPGDSTAGNQGAYDLPSVDEYPYSEVTPEVTPLPEGELYEVQVLTVLGDIQAYLVFFVVVVIAYIKRR